VSMLSDGGVLAFPQSAQCPCRALRGNKAVHRLFRLIWRPPLVQSTWSPSFQSTTK
jgi:hypothetical protein